MTRNEKSIKKLLQLLKPLLKLYPGKILGVTTLGFLSSFLEGLGISLFIPLLESLDQTTAQLSSESPFLESLNQLFIDIPPNYRLLIICLCIFGSIFLKNCLTFANTFLSSWLEAHMSHRLRSEVFKQLLSVSQSFLDASQAGKLLNTLENHTWSVSETIELIVGLIINACTVFALSILLLLISWKLTLLVAVGLVLISFIIRQMSGLASKLGQQEVKVYDAIAIRMLEGFYGMRVIRAFGRESYEQERFDRASNQVRIITLKLAQLNGSIGPLSEILFVALFICILFFLQQNKFNISVLLSFLFILYRLQPHIQGLDSARVELVALTAAVEDVMSFLNRSDKPYIRSGRISFKGLKQAIVFKSVSFGYNPVEKPVLQDLSIHIPRGKTTALVGPSGAGKSTLIKLICRFYDVTEGEIYIDDYPLRQLDLASWRDRIAIVSQDAQIFSTTVYENIAYGRLDSTEDEITAAAIQANAHEFISKLPQGYNTMVGDQGLRLSGGQRQRIALSRAIVRNPEIFILDEATNALDSVSEGLIQEAISALSQNRTVIIVAHRLSTIEQANQIIVLQDGQVIEQGNLQHLLKLNGLFAKLYHLQYLSTRT